MNHLGQNPGVSRSLRVSLFDHWPDLIHEGIAVLIEIFAQVRGQQQTTDLRPACTEDDALFDVGTVALNGEFDRNLGGYEQIADVV